MDQLTFFRHMFSLEAGETINIRAFHATSGRKGYNEFASTPEEAVAIVATIPSNLEIYFAVNPRLGRDGSKAGVLYVQLYHGDADFKWFEDGRAGAIATVMGWHLEPSLVVDSGHGLHCYWLLVSPLPPSQIAVAEDHMTRLYYALGGLDNVQDVSRILRVPGTTNNKDPRNRRPVTVIHQNLAARYTPEDFEQYLPELPRQLEHVERTELLGDEERPSIELLRTLLNYCDPCLPYATYLTIWAAVAYYYPDSEGLALVDEWSSKARADNGQESSPETRRTKHATFKRQVGRVSALGTLYYHARAGGYVIPARPLPLVTRTKRSGTLSVTIKKRREDQYRRRLEEIANPTVDELPHYLQLWYDHLGELVDPFPRDYTTMMGLTFSSLFFPNIKFENLKVNLWINASVEQGSGKNAITDAMYGVVQQMTAITPHLYTSGTAEGMFRTLKGEPGQSLICYLREFGDYLESMTREHMKNARGVLCNLYDGADISHRLSKEETIIKDPFCVIIGTTTPNVLVATMTKEALEGGFASRFWYLAPEWQKTPRNSDPSEEAALDLAKDFDRHILDLINVRRARFDCARGTVPKAYADYEKLCGVGTGEVRTFIDALENPESPKGRFLARVKKVATLLELLDRSPQIEDTSQGTCVVVRNRYLELAIVLVRRGEVHQDLVLSMIGNTQDEKALNAIDRVLGRAGVLGLTRSQILQQAHIKSGELKALLPMMLEEGLVEQYVDGEYKPRLRSADLPPVVVEQEDEGAA